MFQNEISLANSSRKLQPLQQSEHSRAAGCSHVCAARSSLIQPSPLQKTPPNLN